jgi:predicted DNA-binding transcriptional regulator YafY
MRAERLLSILMALQRGQSLTAGELAQRLDVSVRTIFRDVDALSAMGVPVYTEAGRGGGIRLVEGYTSDLTGLSPGEAEALALVGSPASLSTVRELGLTARSALDKLAAAVPSMHQLRAQHARSRLLFDTKPWFRSLDTSPFMEDLRSAVWKDQCVDIAYRRSDGELRDYHVEPYALVVKVDTWYLIGRVKREMRVFRLSRLQTTTATTEGFARDAGFDLQKFWKGWCERFERNPPNNYTVELRISARGRRRLLEHFGAWFRQRLEPLGERFRGRKLVSLDLEREDMALRILFDLGDDAEIVSPRTLRRKLRAKAARIVSATAPVP